MARVELVLVRLEGARRTVLRQAPPALQEALEDYDRAQGEWHGVKVTLEADALTGEDDGIARWRTALERSEAVRDVVDWYPAVVLSMDGNRAVVGAVGDDKFGPNSGAALVFERPAGPASWTQDSGPCIGLKRTLKWWVPSLSQSSGIVEWR